MSCNTASDDPAAVRAAVRAAVLSLIAVADGDWYRYKMRMDRRGRTLSSRETDEVICGSTGAAEEMAGRMSSSGKALPPGECARMLGLRVRRVAEEAVGGYMYLGLYDSPTCIITLNEAILGKVEAFIIQNGLEERMQAKEAETVVLYHEIFHALEDRTPGIYTRSRMLRRRLFGCFSTWQGVELAGEIGAIHFSKLMSGISYSPCVFERILLWAAGRLDRSTPAVDFPF